MRDKHSYSGHYSRLGYKSKDLCEQNHSTDICCWLAARVGCPRWGLKRVLKVRSQVSGGIGVNVNVVKRQVNPNRLDIVLSGSPSMPELETLCLNMLREAAGLQYGFAVSVDARELLLDDPAITPIFTKLFRSLQWFGISRIEHRGNAKHLDTEVQTLYASAGLLGTIPLQLDPV